LHDLAPEFPKITYLVEDLICKEITKIVQFKICGTRLVKIVLCGGVVVLL